MKLENEHIFIDDKCLCGYYEESRISCHDVIQLIGIQHVEPAVKSYVIQELNHLNALREWASKKA